MVQTVSLHGLKSQTLARIDQKPTEKEHGIRHASQGLKFSSQIKIDSVRPPVHQDFNSFMASSAAQIQANISDATKIASQLQHHRFGPEDGSLQKSSEAHKPKDAPGIKLEHISLDKNSQIQLRDAPRVLEILNTASVAQPPKHIADKGYGSRIATDPLIIVATSSDLDKVSMGLVGAVNGHSPNQSDDDFHEFSEKNQKTKASAKASSVSRNEQASLLKREEIEVLRDVKEKFIQQLKAQYPHITVPVKHPEGIVDIHMRFDRKAIGQDGTKGSVRVMFSGSNSQIVTLFAQHRVDFMNIIANEGYDIDPSRMQFNGPIQIKI